MSEHVPPSLRGSNLPDRKVVAASVVAVAAFALAQSGLVTDIPAGVEAAAAVIIAYFWPNS